MEVSDIILLLEYYLKNTYFSFQDQFYEQVEGAAMVPQLAALWPTSSWSTWNQKL